MIVVLLPQCHVRLICLEHTLGLSGFTCNSFGIIVLGVHWKSIMRSSCILIFFYISCYSPLHQYKHGEINMHFQVLPDSFITALMSCSIKMPRTLSGACGFSCQSFVCVTAPTTCMINSFGGLWLQLQLLSCDSCITSITASSVKMPRTLPGVWGSSRQSFVMIVVLPTL